MFLPPTGTKDSRDVTYESLLAANSDADASTTIPEPPPTYSFLDEIAVQLNLQENREEIVRYWNRFTRKRIGLITSLKALGLSSCAIYSFLLSSIDIVLLRVEYPTTIDTICLGVPLSQMVSYDNLHS